MAFQIAIISAVSPIAALIVETATVIPMRIVLPVPVIAALVPRE
jgi:hypothetical protein